MSMKLINLKRKAVIITAGVATLFASSCKDFLEEDLYGANSTTGVVRYDQFQSLTSPLYGGQLWSQYEQKFSWCVNEGLSGVLYNVYDQEGALFKLSIGDDNSILKEGFTSLYSGVIATANQVIHKITRIQDGTDPKPEGFDVSDEQLAEVKGEAMLFRAFAHFLATEYFGEVPLVLDTETDIAQSVKLPKVTRATLYKAIEKDLLYAKDVLPDTPSNPKRASKNSAKAVLAKLYLTMASCQSDLAVARYKESDVAGKYQSVVDLCTEIIGGTNTLQSHKEMFTYDAMTSPSRETIFALYFVNGEYGEGSSYQAQMGRNTNWSPGSGWGGGKGISYNLYKSFSNDDERKRELCLYVGAEPYSIGAGGNTAVYGPDYDPKDDPNQIEGASGLNFLTDGAGGYVFNHVKKFVWGIDNRGFHAETGMSIQRRIDLVRLSDVLMMRAEAKMALENTDVCTPSSAGLEDINLVLKAHGAPQLTEAIPFFEDLSTKRENFESFSIKLDDSTTATVDVPLTETMYHNVERYDLMQERRKEFAMEGQAWLDLKRLYYRDPIMAHKFLVQMDRGVQMAGKPKAPAKEAETEAGYARKAVVNALNSILATMYPEKWEADANAKAEETILIDNFISNNYWFLPIPVSAQTGIDNGAAKDFVNDVDRGTYPY